eukprot:CAMPEP_0176228520 /NCGR_PEP_ID=MMETSP0121_2-20121125/23321_1 /TAXON_ID=160619 /ORGANISM="Kryptoperidinium foliaceum, Strain CCMP 1326" /LENGTH=54 /DNA_ID=CAMNT_0017567825 /DNA_START=35 /DNA_END=195 /DNA_ORIENTATION=+
MTSRAREPLTRWPSPPVSRRSPQASPARAAPARAPPSRRPRGGCPCRPWRASAP